MSYSETNNVTKARNINWPGRAETESSPLHEIWINHPRLGTTKSETK